MSFISLGINSLNGCNFNGSPLVVKIAKENFIDRLKREREEKTRIKPEGDDNLQQFTGKFEPTQPKAKSYENNYQDTYSYNNRRYNEEENYENNSASIDYQDYVKNAMKTAFKSDDNQSQEVRK